MPLCRSPLTLRLALFLRSRTAAVEIPRFILHRRRSEFLPLHRGAEKRAQFALQSTGEARALPRRAQVCLCGTTPLKCAATGGKHSFFMHPKGALHVPKARFIRRRRASFSIIFPHRLFYLPIHYKGKGVGGVVENRREGLHILLGVSAQNPIG